MCGFPKNQKTNYRGIGPNIRPGNITLRIGVVFPNPPEHLSINDYIYSFTDRNSGLWIGLSGGYDVANHTEW